MNFSSLSGFDIEADLAPLTATLHNSTTSSSTQQQQPQQQSNHSPFQFSPSSTFGQQQPSNANGNTDSERKVFFITNCGSLLGRTIAQVALDRGHYIAAWAREKHLADLQEPPPHRKHREKEEGS